MFGLSVNKEEKVVQPNIAFLVTPTALPSGKSTAGLDCSEGEKL
jgi:hypothetical protein